MSLLLKKLVSLAVPAMVATAAFLHVQAIGALVDGAATPKSIEPFALARAAESPAGEVTPTKSAEPILSHNVFDHLNTKLNAPVTAANDPATFDDVDAANAPPCDGVRTVVTVRDDDADKSFAALDVGGKRHLRRRGGSVDGLDVVYVGNDRVWLRRNGALCQATLWDVAAAAKPAPAAANQSALEQDIGKQIVKTGPTSYAIDRGAVSRIMEAQAELMKTPLVPEKENGSVIGYRMTRVKPGSVLSMLGLASGDRLEVLDGVAVSSMDGMMQAYARLSTGTLERMTIQITRAGKPMTLDYTVK